MKVETPTSEIVVKKSHKVTPEFAALSAIIGDFIQFWGFKKIHGQIWAHIYLSKDPIDATTLVKRLGVSKALISLAIKDLMQYEVIQIVGKGLRRKILFRSNPNLPSVISKILQARERKLLAQIASCHKLVETTMDNSECFEIDPLQLQEFGTLVKTAEQTLDYVIDTEMFIKGMPT